MRAAGCGDEAGGLPWYFLTTRSARALMPLVEGFGQDVRHTVDRSSGRPRRELSHVLKVFLIDRAGFIREIYTSTFLHPQTCSTTSRHCGVRRTASAYCGADRASEPGPGVT